MYIVSANYRKNRNNTGEPKWLLRSYDDPPPASAIAVAWVHATGVEFKPSNETEAGFGCTIVAHCIEATHHFSATPSSIHLQEILFDDSDEKNPVFRRKFDRKIVRKCAQLVLEPSGQIFVVLDEEPTD